MNKTYSEKLRDPRWQKKRLEILSRDGFKCSLCGDSKNTLHVHHFTYNNGGEPWDHESYQLTTLCESCHEKEETLKPFTKEGWEYLASIGFFRQHLAEIFQYVSQKSDGLTDLEMREYFINFKNKVLNG